MRFQLDNGVRDAWALIHELLTNHLGDFMAFRHTQAAVNLHVEIDREV